VPLIRASSGADARCQTPSRATAVPTAFAVASMSADAPSVGMGTVASSSRGSPEQFEIDQRPIAGLLDVAATAARLGVTVRFVRRLVAERRIPYVKVGKFVRVDPTELEHWIDEQRIGQLKMW
jgi:excisionase family DNA binding protein